MNISKTKHRTRKSESGFTLIEVLIAIGILSFGILAIASMQSSSLLGTQNAHNVTAGTSWAQDRVEQLMLLNYNNPLLASGVTQTVTNGKYTIQWITAQNSPIANTMTITIDTLWAGAGGTQKMSSLQYILADII